MKPGDLVQHTEKGFIGMLIKIYPVCNEPDPRVVTYVRCLVVAGDGQVISSPSFFWEVLQEGK